MRRTLGLCYCYLTIFLLRYTEIPAKPNALAANSTIHDAIWLLSPVLGEFVSLSCMLSLLFTGSSLLFTGFSLLSAALSSTVNAVVAVPLLETMPIVCSPTESVATQSAFKVTTVLPSLTV